MKTLQAISAVVLIATAGFAIHVTQAQQSGVMHTDVLQHDLGIPGREVIQVRFDFAPGAAFGFHSHPGVEVAYVFEGTLEYQLGGKPPVTLNTGQALFIPAGAFHTTKNVSSVNAVELVTYIVEKGQPLVVLAN